MKIMTNGIGKWESSIKFNEGDYAKRMSLEVAIRITIVGAYYILFKTLTYL